MNWERRLRDNSPVITDLPLLFKHRLKPLKKPLETAIFPEMNFDFPFYSSRSFSPFLGAFLERDFVGTMHLHDSQSTAAGERRLCLRMSSVRLTSGPSILIATSARSKLS